MRCWLIGRSAQWEHVSSIGWSRRVKSEGYSDIYTAPAGLIVPLVLGHELPSDEDVPMRKPHEITIEQHELAMCSADETLTIVVWDQS